MYLVGFGWSPDIQSSGTARASSRIVVVTSGVGVLVGVGVGLNVGVGEGVEVEVEVAVGVAKRATCVILASAVWVAMMDAW
jgi:hypothetical protein